MRALLMQTSFYIDMTPRSPTGEEQERYHSYVEVLTPICKAWASDWGFQVTEWCLQVYGGYGYTSEYPAEQYVRDAKIATIYEGTNGIQALDFVARKLPAKGGKPIRELLGMAEATFKKLQGATRDDGAGVDAGGRAQADRDDRQGADEAAGRRPGHDAQRGADPRHGRRPCLGAHFLLDQAIIARDEAQRDPGGSRASTTEDKKAYTAFLAEQRRTPPSTTTRCRRRSTSPTACCPWSRPRPPPSAPARRRPIEAMM